MKYFPIAFIFGFISCAHHNYCPPLDLREMAMVGGDKVSADDYPASVFFTAFTKNKYISACSGAWISPTRILTAAHCVFDLDQAKLATINERGLVFSRPDEKHPQTVISSAKVKAVYVHPTMISNGKVYSISRIARDLQYGSTSIDLAIIEVDSANISHKSAKLFDQSLQCSHAVLIGGFGMQDVRGVTKWRKRYANEKDKSSPKSDEYVGNFVVSPLAMKLRSIEEITDRTINFSSKEPNDENSSFAYRGDSGGPGYTMQNKEKVIVGVNSIINSDLFSFTTKFSTRLMRVDPASPGGEWLRHVMSNQIKPSLVATSSGDMARP